MKPSGLSVLVLCAGMLITPAGAKSQQRVLDGYGKLPWAFEINQGQAAQQVRFLSRGKGYTLFLTNSEAVMVLRDGSGSPVLRMRVEGANDNPLVSGAGELNGHSNYLIGNNPQKWLSNIPLYTKVRFQGVYPGIDLEYYGNGASLENDFVVAAGSSPEKIRLTIEGGDALTLATDGSVCINVGGGEVQLAKPRIYQVNSQGQEVTVAGRFQLINANSIGFDIGNYDHSRILVIDPQLVYSTFLGGADSDTGISVAVDKDFNAYITGSTSSYDFPTTPGAYAATQKSSFVTKVSADGSQLVYSTYFGSSLDTTVNAIAVNGIGEAYLVGSTRAADFPTTANAFQGNCALDTYSMCTEDAFIAKLSSDGSTLLYSTYLGGGGMEAGYGVVVDSNGNAYAYGATWSTDFPTTPGAFQTQKRGFSDVFVAKVNTSAATGPQSLIYSTCIGGTGNNADQYDYSPHALAVDTIGNVYLAGATLATDFPTTPGAFQTAPVGSGGDAFVVKLNPNGSALVYSTYLGGSYSPSHANSVAVDSGGNAYIVGATGSANFPVTSGSLYDTYNGFGFITKLNPSGSALIFSTYFPGIDLQNGIRSVALDPAGNIFISGVVSNPGADSYPVASPIQAKCAMVPPPASFCSDDLFLAKINAQGNALIFSTFLGGSNSETATGLAVDSAGDVYVLGRTYSVDFPSANSYQSSCATSNSGGCTDVFLAKFSGLKLPVIAGLPQFVNLNPPVASTGTQSITISNRGDAVLNLAGISLGGSGFALTQNGCAPSPGALNPGETCTLTVGFTPSDTDLHSATLTINDNAYLSPHLVALQGAGSDYAMGALPAQATVTAGQAASFAVGAKPINGFNLPVLLTCTGAPRDATCQIAAGTLAMDGSSIVATTVTINTTARTTTSAQSFPFVMPGLAASLGMMCFIGVCLPHKNRRYGLIRRFIRPAAVVVMVGVLLIFVGCGGGGSSTRQTIQGTPAGVYSITVSATSSGLTHNVTFQLTVN